MTPRLDHKKLGHNGGPPVWPELWLTVWVEGNCFRSDILSLFVKGNCYKANSLQDADLVVFSGGADISPSLYGQKNHTSTHCSPDRDLREKLVYEYCVKNEIPMFGICRGAQLLHALNGGDLYQHVDGHAGRPHFIKDLRNNKVLTTSSLHHQMCIPNTKMEIIATAAGVSHSRIKMDGDTEVADLGMNDDLEAFYYPETLSLCTQGHPELAGYDEYSAWCLQLIEETFEHLFISKTPLVSSDVTKH